MTGELRCVNPKGDGNKSHSEWSNELLISKTIDHEDQMNVACTTRATNQRWIDSKSARDVVVR